MKIVVAVTLFALAIIAQGCSTCAPVSPLFVQGETTARIGENGVLLRDRGGRPSRKIVLERPGSAQCIEQDEPFILSMPSVIDMAQYAIEISECDTVTAGAPIYRLQLVESCMPVLSLNKKCKTINWYNPYRIPEIRVNNNELLQVILTPLLGDDLTTLGYEVRMGDSKECESPALKRLKKLRGGSATSMRFASNTKKNPFNPGVFGSSKGL
jgi:hypothetical protein